MSRNRYAVAASLAICMIGGVWIFLLQAAALRFRMVHSPLRRAAELSSNELLKVKIAELLMAHPLVWVLGIFGICMAIAFLLGGPVVEIRFSESEHVDENRT